MRLLNKNGAVVPSKATDTASELAVNCRRLIAALVDENEFDGDDIYILTHYFAECVQLEMAHVRMEKASKKLKLTNPQK